MEKFAGYGFNKSHSAAYAVLSYQTAWLKAHYPAAFMAAVLSADMDRTDKVVTLIDECQRMALDVEPPDVNASQYMFTVSGPRSIRYGLGADQGRGRGCRRGDAGGARPQRRLPQHPRFLPAPGSQSCQSARRRGADPFGRVRLAGR